MVRGTVNTAMRKGSAGQRGAVLITGLTILVVMTLIGITAMQTTVLEERMAGNLRQQNEALQASEAGLQLGLTYLEGLLEAPFVDDVKVWSGCAVDGATCTKRGDEAWLATNGVGYDDGTYLAGVSALTGLSSQPLIAIEERYPPPLDVEAAALGCGPHFYTVYSSGSGTSDEARSLLRTTIAKVYRWCP